MTFWVLIGSLFIFQGPYLQCFGLIHAKNVNTFCMYTAMRKQKIVMLIWNLWFILTFSPINALIFLYLSFRFPIFSSLGSFRSLFHKKNCLPIPLSIGPYMIKQHWSHSFTKGPGVNICPQNSTVKLSGMHCGVF